MYVFSFKLTLFPFAFRFFLFFFLVLAFIFATCIAEVFTLNHSYKLYMRYIITITTKTYKPSSTIQCLCVCMCSTNANVPNVVEESWIRSQLVWNSSSIQQIARIYVSRCTKYMKMYISFCFHWAANSSHSCTYIRSYHLLKLFRVVHTCFEWEFPVIAIDDILFHLLICNQCFYVLLSNYTNTHAHTKNPSIRLFGFRCSDPLNTFTVLIQ